MPMPDALTRQLGPFPVWGWVGIFGAGIGIAMVLRKSDLFADEQLPELPEAGATVPGGPSLAQPNYPAGTGGAAQLPPNPQPGPVSGTGPTTNNEWSIIAVRWLIAAGVDPIVADSAIGKYLQGTVLDARESAALAMALKDGPGPPPEGAPPVQGTPSTPGLPSPALPVSPAPVAPSPPPGVDIGTALVIERPAPAPAGPPADITYTIRAGDTLSGIAQRYYGAASNWRLLYDMNRWVGNLGPNPDLIHPGQQMWLPGRLNNGVERR